MYKNKQFCYLWKDNKTAYPYVGLVKVVELNHPMLDQGKRKKMKVFSIDPNKDIPID